MRIALIAAAVMLMGCSSGEGAAPLSTPSPVASPVASPVQPIVISGKASKVTDPTEIPAGNYRVSWTVAGGTNFIVWIQGQSKDLLVNEAPRPTSGEVAFNSGGGRFILEVKASAAWRITFDWLAASS